MSIIINKKISYFEEIESQKNIASWRIATHLVITTRYRKYIPCDRPAEMPYDVIKFVQKFWRPTAGTIITVVRPNEHLTVLIKLVEHQIKLQKSGRD